MTVELPEPSLPQTCFPVDTRCCPEFTEYPQETQDIAIAMAGETLRALTAYRVGGCPITVRPCVARCNPDSLVVAPVPGAHTAALGAGGTFNPHINAAGSWVNGCGCLRDCSCTQMCIVKLPPPVGWVGEVRLDGAILDPGAYRVDNGNELVRTDGGCWPPCFPAGTLVTTRRGQVPIEDVEPGDEVLTHRGRWRRVEASGQTGVRETVTLSAKGSLTSTADHPVWARTMERVGGARKFSEPEWTSAARTVGRYVAVAHHAPPEEPPTPDGWESTASFWRLVGFWLGDGWTTDHETTRNYGVRISVTLDRKVEYLRSLMSDLPGEWNDTRHGDGLKFSTSDKELWSWLREHFGAGSHGKAVPSWLVGAPSWVREAILDGLVNSDGHRGDGEWRVTTVSKQVAVGLRLLLASLGFDPAAYQHKAGHWQVTWRPGEPVKRQSVRDDRATWVRSRSVTDNPVAVPVYDLTVEEDESFVADGYVVHNCQDMNLPDTEEGTFSVTYLNAFLVDSVGAYAAGILACEFAKACSGGKCRLPAGVTEITRQGVTMSIPAGAFPDGLTGIREVDSYILRWNPYQRKMQPTVTSPDVEPTRWVTSR